METHGGNVIEIKFETHPLEFDEGIYETIIDDTRGNSFNNFLHTNKEARDHVRKSLHPLTIFKTLDNQDTVLLPGEIRKIETQIWFHNDDTIHLSWTTVAMHSVCCFKNMSIT